MAVPMTQPFTKENAKNIFYGGTVFFSLLFLNLVFNTSASPPAHDWYKQLDTNIEMGQKIALGKTVWDQNNCIGCHTLLGEGAYFAPELGNLYQRYDYDEDRIKRFINGRPVNGILGRRSMPQFNLTEKELDALVEFLKYSSKIDTAGWPPNKEG